MDFSGAHLPSRNDSEDVLEADLLHLEVDLHLDDEVPLCRRVERHPVPELLRQVLSVHIVDQHRHGLVVGDAHYRNAGPGKQ